MLCENLFLIVYRVYYSLSAFSPSAPLPQIKLLKGFQSKGLVVLGNLYNQGMTKWSVNIIYRYTLLPPATAAMFFPQILQYQEQC